MIRKTGARDVFGARAAFYRTSPAHADASSLRRLVEHAAPEPDGSVLDLATGAGHAALALAPHVRHVVGLDLTPEMIDQARMLRAERGAANVAFCLGDIADLPARGAAFDLVVCRRAAHHFPDLRRALGEIHRVLRPGGRLVIDDRSVPPDPEIDGWMNRLDLLHDPSHVREYPAIEWQALLGASGFESIVTESYERLRPLDALTEGVPEADAEEIRRSVASMPEPVARAFSRRRVDGQWHILHWFVILFAIRSPNPG